MRTHITYEELEIDGVTVDLRLTAWWQFEGDDDDIVIHRVEAVREDTGEVLVDAGTGQETQWDELLEQSIIGSL